MMLWREATRAVWRLSRTPTFSLTAVFTIAAATVPSVLFRLADRAVLPPLPFERPAELFSIYQRVDFGPFATSYPKLRLLKERSQTLDVAIGTGAALFLASRQGRERLGFEAVTPNYFAVLGAKPLLGRTFLEDENVTPLGHPVAVLSERLWQERFDRRPDIVGQPVVLNGVAFTVIGVMPRTFPGYLGATRRWAGVRGTDGWIPAMMAPLGKLIDDGRTARVLESPDMATFIGVARLRPSRSVAEMNAELAVLDRDARRIWPTAFDETREAFLALPTAREALDPTLVRAVSLLKIAGALTLALGALNLAGMLLARSVERAPTVSLHLMLGASRLAVLREAAVEALTIGAAGGSLALLLAVGTIKILGLVEPSLLSHPLGVALDPGAWQLDLPVILAALGLAIVAAVAATLVPAWQGSRRDLAAVLRRGGPAARGLRSMRATRPRGIQVALQIACALALTLPTLLLVRSLGRLLARDPGFQPRGVVAAHLDLPPNAYRLTAAPPFIGEVLRRLREQPDIAQASWVSCVPLECPQLMGLELRLEQGGATGVAAYVQTVAPGAFRTLGIPLKAGRDFDEGDSAQAPPVVLLSAKATYALNRAGVGSRVMLFGRPATVIGVVGDVQYGDPAGELLPTVYAPLAQRPQPEGALVLRTTAGGIAAADGVVRSVLSSLDPSLKTTPFTLNSVVTASRSRIRAAGWLLGSAALLALLLAGVGVYGLLALTVARARPEIGVRIALGASPRVILWQVLLPVLALTGLGLGIGTLAGMRCASYLHGYLYDVTAWDLSSLLALVAIAAALAVFAALGPARRAAKVDPMVALRCE